MDLKQGDMVQFTQNMLQRTNIKSIPHTQAKKYLTKIDVHISCKRKLSGSVHKYHTIGL